MKFVAVFETPVEPGIEAIVVDAENPEEATSLGYNCAKNFWGGDPKISYSCSWEEWQNKKKEQVKL